MSLKQSRELGKCLFEQLQSCSPRINPLAACDAYRTTLAGMFARPMDWTQYDCGAIALLVYSHDPALTAMLTPEEWASVKRANGKLMVGINLLNKPKRTLAPVMRSAQLRGLA